MNEKFRGNFTTIKDLSNQRRLPRLGKIRLGVKVVNPGKGTEYPKETQHFVVPPEVEKIYGATPTELDVLFPLNDIRAIFPQAYKHYGKGRGLKCVGNGETAMQLDETSQAMKERECPCDKLTNKECQKRAHLMIILPKVSMGGVYQIDLGSTHSIIDINSGLNYVQLLVGRFAMVPLKLRRVPRDTFNKGQKATHYCLQVVLEADEEKVALLQHDNSRVIAASERLALAPPEDCSPQFDEEATVEMVNDQDDAGVPPAAGSEQPAKHYTIDRSLKEQEEAEQTSDVTGSSPSPNPPKTQAQKPAPAQDEAQEKPPATEPGDTLATTLQHKAILALASKAGVDKETILSFLFGISDSGARKTIQSLQRGDTSMFEKRVKVA